VRRYSMMFSTGSLYRRHPSLETKAEQLSQLQLTVWPKFEAHPSSTLD
jgi:hypothetical protein